MAQDWLILGSIGATSLTATSTAARSWSLVGRESSLADTQNRYLLPTAYTWKQLSVAAISNTADVTHTFRSNINNSNGNQSVTIAAATTGIFEDTSNTDSVSDGDYVRYGSAFDSTGTGTLVPRNLRSVLTHASTTAPQLFDSSQNFGASPGQTSYAAAVGGINDSSTEANMQITWRTACTLSNLGINVRNNTIAGNSTCRIRINGSDGNQVISITGDTTGFFEDTTNSDSISVGDEVNLALIGGTDAGGGSVGLTMGGFNSSAHVRMGPYDSGEFVTGTTPSYHPLNADLDASRTTESDAQHKSPGGFTFKNVYVYLSANTYGSAASVALRKNGSDTVSVTITASTTGAFEETSTQVSIADDDLINWRITGGGNQTYTVLSIEQIVPAAETVLTPDPAALITTGYASTVLAPRLVTPGAVNLVTTNYAPSSQVAYIVPKVDLITTSFISTIVNPQSVTPGLLELLTELFEPEAQTTVLVTPDTINVLLALFAPSVVTPVLTTPGLAELATTLLEPSINIGVTATPGLVTLVTTRYAPRLNQTITPSLATLLTQLYAPKLNLSIIPPLVALETTNYAPSIGITNHIRVTPDVKALITSLLVPTVINPKTYTPGLVSLVIVQYSPDVTTRIFSYGVLHGTARPSGLIIPGRGGKVTSPRQGVARLRVQ